MSGKAGRSGRKPIPIERHILRGTYRPDRHGPLPDKSAVEITPAMRLYLTTGEFPGDRPETAGMPGWFALYELLYLTADPDAALAPYRELFQTEKRSR